MTIFDYIVLGGAVVALVIGLVKGFVKQLMGFVSALVVSGGTFLLYQHPESWLMPMFAENPLVATAIAIVATLVVLWLACLLVTKILNKIIGKVKALKAIDRILGAVMGVAIVYCVVAVVAGFLTIESDFAQMLREMTGDFFTDSWVLAKVYATNPIGDMLINFLGLGS